MIILTLSHP